MKDWRHISLFFHLPILLFFFSYFGVSVVNPSIIKGFTLHGSTAGVISPVSPLDHTGCLLQENVTAEVRSYEAEDHLIMLQEGTEIQQEIYDARQYSTWANYMRKKTKNNHNKKGELIYNVLSCAPRLVCHLRCLWQRTQQCVGDEDQMFLGPNLAKRQKLLCAHLGCGVSTLHIANLIMRQGEFHSACSCIIV